MRVLSTILSLYFLALAVMPCADGEAKPDVAFEQILAEHDHSGHEHPAGEDLCSPFCICNCCHTPVIGIAALEISLMPASEISLNQTYKAQLSAPFPHSLFQPPRA